MKFLHLGDEAGMAELVANAAQIADAAALSTPLIYSTRSQINEAKNYLISNQPQLAHPMSY